MKPPRSDALVLFGATGDLSHKKIFPALYAMVKRGTLNEPVIGVAFDEWDDDKLESTPATASKGPRRESTTRSSTSSPASELC